MLKSSSFSSRFAVHVLFGVTCSKIQGQYDAFAVERFFPLLKAIGVKNEVAETKEARRLVLD
jgi:hypothetical protein